MKTLTVLFFIAIMSPAQAAGIKGFKEEAKEVAPMVIKTYGPMIKRAAYEFGVSPVLAATIIIVETHGKRDAVHNSSAVGLMGVKPSTALADVRRYYKDLHFGSNLKNPRNNIRVAIAYLAMLRNHYGFTDPARMSVAYRVGPTKAGKMSLRAIYNHPYAKKVEWVKSLPEIPVLF